MRTKNPVDQEIDFFGALTSRASPFHWLWRVTGGPTRLGLKFFARESKNISNA